ncbi:unnamed protein product [Ceutorhynchus assimilis]|uniref:MD-2-related lipid-recognition domain-containing protein n=1 Tax=Ceutorhynchus assimilis TaxID=467358 RepID=A0A9N9QLB9_9CUCU|nr:unnamed protein product [Ceutorhynchus assimilis]
MYIKSVLFASVLVVLISASCATWRACETVTNGVVSSVVVSKCLPNAKRCILKRNTNASMEIDFTPDIDADKITAEVKGYILGVPAPFNLPNPDGCTDSGITCPIKASSTYKYKAQIPILPSYPRVTVDIQWKLKDGEGKDIICAMIPAKIG